MFAVLALTSLSLFFGPPNPPDPPAGPDPAALARITREQTRNLREKLHLLSAMAGERERPPELQGDWPDEPSGKKVTLDGELALGDAVQKIAKAAGWNLVMNLPPPVASQKLTLHMKDAPVEDAIEAVTVASHVGALRTGDTVTVSTSVNVVPPQKPVLSGFDKPSGKTFTGDFDDDEAGDALRKIADAAGWSLVLPPGGITNPVSAHFKNAPVEEAMKAVAQQAQLSAALESGVVSIAHRAPRMVMRAGKKHFSFQVNGTDDGDVDMDLDVPEPPAPPEPPDLSGVPGGKWAQEHSLVKGRDKVASGDITVSAGERWRDVVALRGNVKLEPGAHVREVTAVLGSVELGPGATVDHDAVAVSGDLHVSPGARVGHDAVSVGGQLVVDPGGAVEGTENSIALPGLRILSLAVLGGLFHRTALGLFAGALSLFAVAFVLGLLIIMFWPKRMDAVAAAIGNQPVKATLLGLLGYLLFPVLVVLLVATVIGIPLLPVALLGLAVAWTLGWTSLAIFIGRHIPVKLERGEMVARLAMGIGVLVVVWEIPVLGVLVGVCASLLVFGAVLITKFGQTAPGAPLAPPAAPTVPA